MCIIDYDKQDVNAHVGKRLRLRRKMMGLSQTAIAEAAGITFQQVQKYEKGANAMNSYRLYEFARIMQIPVAYFFEELEEQSALSHDDNLIETDNHSPISEQESLEMMQAFNRINTPLTRKRVTDLVRAITER